MDVYVCVSSMHSPIHMVRHVLNICSVCSIGGTMPGEANIKQLKLLLWDRSWTNGQTSVYKDNWTWVWWWTVLVRFLLVQQNPWGWIIYKAWRFIQLTVLDTGRSTNKGPHLVRASCWWGCNRTQRWYRASPWGGTGTRGRPKLSFTASKVTH